MPRRIATAALNVLRSNHRVLDPVTGLYVRSTLLEDARTNLALMSADFSAAGSWAGAGGFTLASATSFIDGQTARRHTDDGVGNRSRSQAALGTLGSAPETVSYIVEQVNALVTRFGIRDVTVGDWVALVTFTWATGVISVTNNPLGTAASARAEQLAAVGPNGGALWRLSVTATPLNVGNTRGCWLYPTGTVANTLSVIAHHGQHEVGGTASSPIVTAGASVTRAQDRLSYALDVSPQALSFYVRFVERGTTILTSSFLRLLSWGTSSTNRISLRSAAGNRYQMQLDNVSVVVSIAATAAIAIGDRVEVLGRLYADGSVDCVVSVNGAAEVSGPRTAALGMPATLGSTLYVGSNLHSNQFGFNAFLPNAHAELVTWRRGLKSMAQMRAAFGA